ncbi:MAG: alpha/beta hydrolase [Alphaproteobacteria bacterium]|nr:alpha/beta hydrolase [Alphaproteobacteria bacterium]
MQGRPPVMKRWRDQRWILDAVVRTVGIEWDQARISSKARPIGAEAEAEFRAVANRIRKYDDIHREFASQARKREARAAAFEKDGRVIAAREAWLTASLLWSTACWPIHEDNETLRFYEDSVNRCYDGFIRHASRPVERVEIPFEGKFLPAYLHLPRKPAAGERLPLVIIVGGMDSSKENMVSLYGDRFLERGFAALALDGPGQAEAITRGIFFTEYNFAAAAQAVWSWLEKRSDIDPAGVVVRGTSFGSYFGTVFASGLGGRIKGFAATGVCQEPGCDTIFNAASPTFKMRFMFMSGYEDEAAFDHFCQKIDLRPIAPQIDCPYMVVAGEADQLSPIEHTEHLFSLINAPKKLVIYEGANHGVGDAPSVANGEEKVTMIADWLLDRINGKPFVSERVFVDSSGRASATPY